MQKTKLGITISGLAAAIYLTCLFGGYIPAIILTGYVLMVEENEWLRRNAVKAIVLMMIFSVFIYGINLQTNQRIIAGNAQFTGIAAGRGVGFTTGLLLLREGLGMRETPIRPHSWH